MGVKTQFELEAWTLPGVGAFTSVVTAVPAINISYEDLKSGKGAGSFQINPNYPDLDLICNPDTNTETFMRIKLEGQYIGGFYARDRKEAYADRGLVTISGPSVEAVFDDAIVYAYDFPRFDKNGNLITLFPDWHYGSEQNGMANGDFEQVPEYYLNRGFELGVLAPWQQGPLTSATVVSGGSQDGTFHAAVTPAVFGAGITLTVPVVPQSRYIFSVWVRGSGTISFGASVPGDIIEPELNAAGETVAQRVIGSTAQPSNPGGPTGSLLIQYDSGIDDPDDPNYVGVAYVEMDVRAAVGGSWTLLVLDFITGVGQTSTDLSIRNRQAVFNFDVDNLSMDGLGIGLEGWRPVGSGNKTHSGAWPRTAQIDEDPVDVAEGTYSGEVLFTKLGQGLQYPVSGADPGGTYTLTGKIKAVAGAKVRIVVTDVLGNWFPQFRDGTGDAAIFHTGTNSFVDFSLTFTLPTYYPGDGVTVPPNDTIIVKAVGGDDLPAGSAQSFHIDDVKVVPGVPAATIGQIMRELWEDAAIDHIADGRTTVGGAGHLAWMTLNFSDTLDSAGNAWSTPANPSGLESMTIKRGISYGQFLESEVTKLGYEWQLVWTGSAWNLEIFNPSGMGTDLSGTVSLITGKIGPSEIGMNAPGGNSIVGEGGDGILAIQTEAADITNYGRRERYFPNERLISHGSLSEWTDAQSEIQGGLRQGHRLELNDSSDFLPWIDFSVGDIVNVNLGAKLSSRNLPVKKITARFDDQKVKIDIDVDTDPPPDSAIPYVAILKILNRFEGIDDDFAWRPGAIPIQTGAVGGGSPAQGGGAPTIVIAASDATSFSKSKADFVCTGTNDEATVQAAIELLATTGGRILLSEGRFHFNDFLFIGDLTAPFDFDYGGTDNIAEHITLQGMGIGATVVLLDYPAGGPTGGLSLVQADVPTTIRDINFLVPSGSDIGTPLALLFAERFESVRLWVHGSHNLSGRFGFDVGSLGGSWRNWWSDTQELIRDCIFDYNSTTNHAVAGGGAIWLEQQAECYGNKVWWRGTEGFGIATDVGGLIYGNVIWTSDTGILQHTVGRDTQIRDNLVYCANRLTGVGTDAGSRKGIYLQDHTSASQFTEDVTITGNRVTEAYLTAQKAGTFTNAVYIDSGGGGNRRTIVANNDLREGHQGTAIVDLGTGTLFDYSGAPANPGANLV